MWETIIPAAAAVIGGLISKSGQQSTNASNVQLTEENRDWMERMSSTSYQRGVVDMEQAGLNPMLAYSQGGASTPTSAAPVVQNALGAGVQGAVSSAGAAIQGMQAVQQIQQSRAATDQAQAMADKLRSETMDRNLNTAELAAKIGQTNESAGHLKQLATNTQEAILGTRYASSTAQANYRAMMNQEEFKGTGFGADVDRRKAEARLAQLQIPVAENEARFVGQSGTVPQWLRSFGSLMSGANSARSLIGR